jgi:hypothetical protein
MLTGVDAVIARDEIRQLAYRYAWLLDTRDIDRLVGLFVPETRNRGELHADLTKQLAPLGPTTLLVGNHIIDFDPDDDDGPHDDRAHGIVYCRGYISEPAGFVEQMIVYTDRYRSDDGHWRFVGRRHELVYGVRTAEQPYEQGPADWPTHSVGVGTIPGRLDTWQRFARENAPR